MSVGYRFTAIKSIARRDLSSILYGIGIYVVLSVVFLFASSVNVRDSLFQVSQNNLMVLSNPINRPLFMVIGLIAAYLGLTSAITISRERDLGTLEVLFYGPVDSVSYILAKYIQQMMVFLVTLALSFVFFWAVSVYTNLGFSKNLAGLLLLSLVMASSMVAFGIFLSSITRRMTVSVVLFLGLALFFLVFSIAHSIVMTMPGEKLSTALVYVRIVLDNMDKLVRWISPIAYLERGGMAIALGEPLQYLWSVLSSVAYTVVLLALATFAFNRKGVRK